MRTFEVSQEAEDAWVQTILELAQFNLDFLESCTPGYYNNEGKPSERGIRNGFYGAGSVAFFNVIADWRAKGDLPGMDLDPPPERRLGPDPGRTLRPGSGPRRVSSRTVERGQPGVLDELVAGGRAHGHDPADARDDQRIDVQRGHDLAAGPEQLEPQHRVVVEEEGDPITVAAHDRVAHGERPVLPESLGQAIEAQLVARALEHREIR